MKGFKVVREDHVHNGFKYQEGLNIDQKPFSVEGSCVEGGLYFFTNITSVFKWLSYGVYLYEVTVPDDHQYVLDPEGDKYRASGLYISNPRDLREVDTWEYLIQQGADIHMWDNEALRLAAEKGHLDIVKFLVENDANIHAANDHAANDHALHMAATCGHLEVVKYLVSKGADIHAQEDFALRWSAKNGYLGVVEYLVKKGADIHARGDEALCRAALHGHLDVVKFLVENDANIHAYNDYALRWSAEKGHLEVVEYLKAVGDNYERV